MAKAVCPDRFVNFELIDLRRGFFFVWLVATPLIALVSYLLVFCGCLLFHFNGCLLLHFNSAKIGVSWNDQAAIILVLFFSAGVAFFISLISYKSKLREEKRMPGRTCRKCERRPVEGSGREQFLNDLEGLVATNREPKVVRSLRWYYVFYKK